MMSMMKKRAEAARRKRIDHVFVKADDNSNGKITPQQMIKLFTANGEVNILSLYSGSSSGPVSEIKFTRMFQRKIYVNPCSRL